VSSTQLIATITIAPDAAIDLYDIAVTNSDRKKGIGYALFEITQAIVVSGTQLLRGVNDLGDMTGGVVPGVVHFNPATGLELVDPLGVGWAIDPTGTAIVGHDHIWNRIGGVWQATATLGGRGSSLASDGNGQVLFIGGLESVATGKHGTAQLPRLWSWRAATNDWGVTALPIGSSTQGDVLGVSDNGVAVGWVSNSSVQAAVWEPSGSGYSLTLLPSGLRARGINRAGTLIVGYGPGAAYWQRLPAGGWSAPVQLPGGCGTAIAVNDLGQILADDCPVGNRSSPAVLPPPYSTTTMIRLGGLGPTNAGYANGMSLSGNYVVGQAKLGSSTVGIYWKLF